MKYPFVFPSVPRALCVAVFCCLSTAPYARAELTIYAQETGGDVVLTFLGSMNMTGADPDGDFGPETRFEPMIGVIEAWQTDSDVVRLDLDAAVPFGTGGDQDDVGVGSGDNIALFESEFFLDDTYVSGSPLNATLTFAGTDFATLGVDDMAGPYVWTVTGNGDTITMVFTAPPEPVAVVDNSAARAALLKKIKKLQKKSKKFKKKGKKAKAKKLGKKVKKLQAQLAALG